MLQAVIHLFKPRRTLGLIGTMCFVALIFSCECETDSPTASVAASNIVINEGPGPLSIVTNNSDTLSATVLPANHTEGDVMWSSSSTEIVSVIKDDATTATYTGVAVGSATVTAAVGGVSTNIVIKVVPNAISATSITINQGERLVTNLGSIGRLTATVLPTRPH